MGSEAQLLDDSNPCRPQRSGPNHLRQGHVNFRNVYSVTDSVGPFGHRRLEDRLNPIRAVQSPCGDKVLASCRWSWSAYICWISRRENS
ncbi:hypothetical protein EG68_00477 [Paragonimus skrjabini miyazakii]|uniref:Uncharacterized protein n=1 Tax=Paragonimus skrjabini miyazakii TaxID=59628 RepID=A0A8S9Z476_9TREM|nr:hypothetical protein EG68_00477 [Paragonimus skrjabini miyazakii]